MAHVIAACGGVCGIVAVGCGMMGCQIQNIIVDLRLFKMFTSIILHGISKNNDPYMATQTMLRPTGTCSYNYCKCLATLCWISNWTEEGLLVPLIAKITLDCEISKNYRPLSNLSCISKLMERVVCVQLVEHLKTNNLYRYFSLLTDFTAQRQHSFEYEMTISKLLTLREEPL